MKIYLENIEKYRAEALRLKKILNRISLLRLLIFILFSILLIALFSKKLFTPFFIIFPIFILSFAIAIKRYNKIAYLRRQASFLENINEAEVLREQCQLETFDTGKEFINQDHPYTSDLDIFGPHSIFQLINRTTTESGSLLLSAWLSAPAPNPEIAERQAAIKELSPKLVWRQDFQAAGMHFQNKKSDYRHLINWVEEPLFLLNYRQVYIIMATIVLSILSSLGLCLFIANLDSGDRIFYLSFLILILSINYLILKKLRATADSIVETAQTNIDICRGYQTLIHKIEAESFQSKKLSQLKTLLSQNDYSAFQEIKKLCQLLDFSQQRGVNKIKMPIKGNAFYSLLNSFLLLDIYLVLGVEKWKRKNKAFLKSWTEAVSEFEVINSFAGFCYSNPSYTFPVISEANQAIHFEALGHPLINPNNRICNNFDTEGPGQVVMITGSNMAGKSTFLRTVGVNFVLTLAGAPCCATKARLPNLQLFTSMRTQDNLRTGVSSFFAELSRIERMLKLIKDKQNVFFLLDEMFKGTNSEDRHRGGFSLINQLSQLQIAGIIATHDIELAKLAGSKQLVDNYSFNSEIKDNTMTFSYQLEPHICNDFNASELMKRSGIAVLAELPEE